MGCEDMAIRRIEDRGLDRSPEDRLGVAEEEGIERVVSGDEDGERRLPRPAGATGADWSGQALACAWQAKVLVPFASVRGLWVQVSDFRELPTL